MNKENAILKWLADYRHPHETKTKTLTRLLQKKSDTNSFIKTIIQNPRDNKPAYRDIIGAFKTKKQARQWFFTYQDAYSQYINTLFKRTKSIDALLQIMPNFSPWSLEQKFTTVSMGSVPPAFQDENHFLQLISKIYNSQVMKNFKRIKKLECSLPDFSRAFPKVKKIDWFDFTQRSDFLRALVSEKCGKPFTLKQNNHTYHITFLCNPFSRKIVFKIDTGNDHFILKMCPYRFLNIKNDRVRKEHENMAISADSTYSDAVLEFYLKLNHCLHAPDILYYHFNHEVVLYRAETGKPLAHLIPNKPADFYDFNTRYVPDAARLGVYVNDINSGNFLISDRDGQVKIIDIGHATFVNPLTPGVAGLTFTLGNLCGQDTLAINGVLDMEDV